MIPRVLYNLPGKGNFYFSILILCKSCSVLSPKMASHGMEYIEYRHVSTLKWPQLTNLTIASANIVKSGKGSFLSGTSEKCELIMEKYTHIITYEQTILKIRPTQVGNKTPCFLQSTHMRTLRSVMWFCSMLTVVVDKQVLWVKTNECEIQLFRNSFKWSSVTTIPTCLRIVRASCKDISGSTFKDIANLSDVIKNRNQI